MGLKEFWSKLRKKREEYAIKMELGESSIKIYGDAKLQVRMEEYQQLQDIFKTRVNDKLGPVEKIHDLMKRLEEMDLVMKKATVPYLRAGDEPAFAKMMGAWEKLRALAMNDLLVLEEDHKDRIREINDVLKGKDNEKKRREQTALLNMDFNHVFSQMQRFLNEAVFRYGWKIMDIAFFRDDVAPSYVTVIQSFSKERRLQGTEN